MVFDDPSTEQPADFWLHPCDCLPLPWGSAWPADSLALENIPPGSNGSFIPPPFLIVSGAVDVGIGAVVDPVAFWRLSDGCSG